jgi:hypothetical protein
MFSARPKLRPLCWHPDETDATEYYYDVADFPAAAVLRPWQQGHADQTINEITKLLEARPTEPPVGTGFHHPSEIHPDGGIHRLGPALILWLRLVIEQQTKKRKVRQTDAVLAEWLHTTRRTITTYKRSLHELGYLKIDTSTRPQRLSVRYFPK